MYGQVGNSNFLNSIQKTLKILYYMLETIEYTKISNERFMPSRKLKLGQEEYVYSQIYGVYTELRCVKGCESGGGEKGLILGMKV